MKKQFAGMCFVIGMLSMATSAIACTNFRLTAKDGTILITRSMEFTQDLQSNIRTSTQNRTYTSTSPNGKQGLTWKAKYGYVFADALGQDVVADGMNEAGLTIGVLYLPGETQYQTIPAGKDNQSMPYLLFGDWVLSNFKSVDEVKAALSNVYVYAQTIPALGKVVFPFHYAIDDASGKGIVVEYVGGKLSVHDSIGILTNSPVYEWQVTNLKNYLHLSPYAPDPLTVNGITYSATGQGAGSVGLPGDVSPPSRFVKASFLAKVSYPASDAATLLNLAEHIINNVDIPAGLARAKSNGKETSDTTQWVVFKNLTAKEFTYRTYNDMTLRKVILKDLDFSEKATRLKMPMSETPYMMNVTERFKKTF